ncbi:hypothetical protein DFH07DRAFT_432071 [Mycena maculata]|uniref:Uncharacterized protein n=1 Tax=Mycena maculata TaxID=230809 RepID=A0AAD7K8I8_9AGAR|nr:hypothetical protein DFH07DRAFT_432071 [Mycena maculata]
MNFARQTSSTLSAEESNASSPTSAAASAVVPSVLNNLFFLFKYPESLVQGRADPSANDAAASNSAVSGSNSALGSDSVSASAPLPSSSASSPNSDLSISSSSESQSTSSLPSTSHSSATTTASSSTTTSASSSSPSTSSASAPSTSSSASATSSVTTITTGSSLTDSVTNTNTASTTSFTTITSSVGGHLTTITSAIPPTSLATAAPGITTGQRTAIIAGGTAAGVAIVLLLLGALFVYKRHKGRKLEFSEAIGRVRREAHGAGGVGLLDEEGFDDEDSLPMRRYQDNVVSHSHSRSMNASSSTLGPPQSPAPSLFRQRAETGSLFREEGVWPPPQGNHFVDPLVGVGTGGSLTRIVDDVMGPSKPGDAAAPPARGNIPSMSSASSSLFADPFRDVSHSTSPSDHSVYYDRRGASSSMSSNTTHTAGSRPSTPQSLLGLPAGAVPTPKKSSPLAGTNPPSAPTAWLDRSPKKHVRGLSGSSSTEG